ncbi:hypothetical protein A8W25_03390 [Streptomyces sp. ERV7]|nr:hypothetical protein A8W25_03390 [Streptomyces sp. ERV7]
MLSLFPSPTASTVYGGTSGLLSTSMASPAALIAERAVSRCPLMATASAPDCHRPLTMRCMSRSRTRPVSEKPLFSRGPPPPPVSVFLASSTTSFTPGPRTSVAPDSSATSSPWSPPCFSSALRWRSPTSWRSESTSFWRSSAALVSASTRPISSWRSLATTGAVIRACAAPIVTTTAASSRPAASPSFALKGRGMPSCPSALRRAVASA